MADRETISERAAREREERERQAAQRAAETAASALGGMSGKAAGVLMGRKRKIEEDLERAEKGE